MQTVLLVSAPPTLHRAQGGAFSRTYISPHHSPAEKTPSASCLIVPHFSRNTTSICSLAPFSSRRPSSSTPDMSPHAAARLLQDLFTASHLVPYRSLPKYSLDSSHTPISFSQLSPPRDTTLSCVIIWHALFVLYCLFSLECKRHRGKNVSRVLLTPNAWNRIHRASRCSVNVHGINARVEVNRVLSRGC